MERTEEMVELSTLLTNTQKVFQKKWTRQYIQKGANVPAFPINISLLSNSLLVHNKWDFRLHLAGCLVHQTKVPNSSQETFIA